jgi:hypothetical protein
MRRGVRRIAATVTLNGIAGTTAVIVAAIGKAFICRTGRRHHAAACFARSRRISVFLRIPSLLKAMGRAVPMLV